VAEQVKITIVGTGCVGSSIGLALHQATQPLAIVGHDKDAGNAGTARKMKAVDRTDWNLINACEDADLVILSIPINAIEDTLKAIAPYLKAGCVIADTASLKHQVMLWAEQLLPDTVSFVGGDPLVAPTGTGPSAARADLFKGSLYCLTPSGTAHPDAVSLMSSLVTLLGARPFYLDAVEHDGLTAGVAQLPQALALAFVHRVLSGSGWRDMRKLAGGSFEAFSALIGEDAETLTGALRVNRAQLLPWLDAYLDGLQTLRKLVAADSAEPLSRVSEEAIDARRQWVNDRRHQFSEDLPTPPIEKPNLLHQIVPRKLLERR
jgi:prephenate dehydrogenase